MSEGGAYGRGCKRMADQVDGVYQAGAKRQQRDAVVGNALRDSSTGISDMGESPTNTAIGCPCIDLCYAWLGTCTRFSACRIADMRCRAQWLASGKGRAGT